MSRKATPPIVDSLSADDFLQKLDENAAAWLHRFAYSRDLGRMLGAVR